MPDELTGPAQPPGGEVAAAPVPVAPPAVAVPVHDRETRVPGRPSLLRAALWSLVVLLAGTALGGAAYRLERSSLHTPTVARNGAGWVVSSHAQREITGLGLSGTHLIWQDGASIEYLDLDRGRVLVLGPGPGMRTTWDPAVGDRYAIWFEAERQASVAAQAVAYDLRTGRRWVRADIGSVSSYPAISGDLAVWSSAVDLGEPAVWGVRIADGGSPFQVATGYGAPVVSGELVVWARSWTGPFTAKEIQTGASWRAADALTNGKLTGLALSGRTLVWGQAGDQDASGVVAVCGVDGGGTKAVASAVTGLSGPSYDGRTIVWGERGEAGDRVMARRPAGGDPFVVADVDGTVTEVAVSGTRAAWIQHGPAGYSIVVRELPQ